MVGVGVRGHQPVDRAPAVGRQSRGHRRGLPCGGVDEHRLAIGELDQARVALAHVEEPDDEVREPVAGIGLGLAGREAGIGLGRRRLVSGFLGIIRRICLLLGLRRLRRLGRCRARSGRRRPRHPSHKRKRENRAGETRAHLPRNGRDTPHLLDELGIGSLLGEPAPTIPDKEPEPDARRDAGRIGERRNRDAGQQHRAAPPQAAALLLPDDYLLCHMPPSQVEQGTVPCSTVAAPFVETRVAARGAPPLPASKLGYLCAPCASNRGREGRPKEGRFP